MRLKYDQSANALYIYLQEGVTPAGGAEIDAGTIVDLDDSGRVVGIELLNPARPWPLDEIAERFEIDMADVLALAALASPERPFAYGAVTTEKYALVATNN